MTYSEIIEAMKRGERFKADSGHTLTLAQDANDRWHLVCFAQSWTELEGAYVCVGEKFLSYPMELGDFVNWADTNPEKV